MKFHLYYNDGLKLNNKYIFLSINMEIVIGTETSIYLPVKNVSSIEDLRESLFFLRNGSVINPNKEMCSLYNAKHGDVITYYEVITNSLWRDEKGFATVIGVYDSKLWFQLHKNDNGRLSYWGKIKEPLDLASCKEFTLSGTNIKPRYITHYELYSIIYNPHCISERGAEYIMKYPIYPSIFLLPMNSYFKDDTQIMEFETDYISTLPLEILFEIFQKCSGLDVFYSMLVCRAWREGIKQCGVWKKLCTNSGIKYNETILLNDYDGNQAEYYFSHGLERRVILDTENLSDIDSICNKNCYLGGLYWNFTKTVKGLLMSMCNMSIREFDGIKINILISVSAGNETFNYNELYDHSSEAMPLFFDFTIAVKYTITIKIHYTLISLMYRTTLK